MFWVNHRTQLNWVYCLCKWQWWARVPAWVFLPYHKTSSSHSHSHSPSHNFSLLSSTLSPIPLFSGTTARVRASSLSSQRAVAIHILTLALFSIIFRNAHRFCWFYSRNLLIIWGLILFYADAMRWATMNRVFRLRLRRYQWERGHWRFHDAELCWTAMCWKDWISKV